MALGIPQETVELVRSQTDIVEVISEYLTLKKAGANYKACCPFHSEKTPSFMVSRSKQIFHCFGCGAGGNVFSFLTRQEGFTFPEAVRYLAERLGIQIKQAELPPGQKQLREQLLDLYEFAESFFRRSLKSPEAEHARNYLETRKISADAIERFSIGYAPAAWDSFRKAASKRFSEELLVQAGLARKGSEDRVYDTFRNRIMFPIHGLSGKVIAFGGRTLEENQPKYINSPETLIYQKGQTLFNLHQAKRSIANHGVAIVVEGYTDLIRLDLAGIENVVASLGTAFTQAQARLIKRYASEVVLVFDSDSAGMSAAGRGVEVLLSEDLSVRVAVLPSGKDPDDYILEHGAEAFSLLVDAARNFVEFHLENAMAARGKGNDLEGRVKTATMLASLIGTIPNPIRREEYLRLVAGRTGIKPEILLETSQKRGFGDKIEEEVKSFEKKLRHEEKECMWLIKLLIERPQCAGTVKENLDLGSIENGPLRELFTAIFECEAESIQENKLLDKVQGQEAQQMLSRVVFEEDGPQMLYPVEWWVALIKCRQEEKKLNGVKEQIAEAERQADSERLVELLKKKQELNREVARLKKGMLDIPVDSLAARLAE